MSGKRNVVFSKGEAYHVFNRATANEQIFYKKKDLQRALDLISYYRYKQKLRYSFFERLKEEDKEGYLNTISKKPQIVEIYSYALMPNHFHFLLRELEAGGVKNFLSNLQNGFAKYFNIKNKRFGSLFQRPFKAKHVDTDEEALYLSRYIHLNPTTSFIMEYEDLLKSNLTSYPYYNSQSGAVVSTEFLIKLAGSGTKYEKFVANQVDYQRKLAKIKHLIIEKQQV